MNPAYARLPGALQDTLAAPCALELAERASGQVNRLARRELTRWQSILEHMPPTGPEVHLDRAAPVLGATVSDPGALRKALLELQPWHQGPLRLGGVEVDAEWRSDLTWERLAQQLELQGRSVLVAGCGNGYFGWRMLGAGARVVVGVDTRPVCLVQWLAQRHFAPDPDNFVLPLLDVQLPADLGGFDTVLSQSVIYHKRDPLAYLRRLRGWLAPGGELVLETLVLDRPGSGCLAVQGCYAGMRDVWFVPTPELLADSLARAGFEEARVVDVTATTAAEQRRTEWMPLDSLAEGLDSADPERTVEGYPAPVRAIVLARRPSV